MKKILEILQKKAKNTLLGTALAAASLGFSATSCTNVPQNTDEEKNTQELVDKNKDKEKEIKQKWKNAAKAELKKIEEAGIATSKKDKDGNITEILVSIDRTRNDELQGDLVVTHCKYSNPKYIPVHQKAHTEDVGEYVVKNSDGSEEYVRNALHHPDREYETTPVSTYLQPKESDIVRAKNIVTEVIKGNETVADISENGDTLVQTKIKKVQLYKNVNDQIVFKYPMKPLTKVMNKSQQAPRRGSRNI